MRSWTLAVAFASGALLGCAGAAPQPAAEPPPASPLGSPFSDQRMGFATISYPLIIDRTDFALGTTVQFKRMPTLTELHDAQNELAIQHLLITLPSWPEAYAPLDILNQIHDVSDVIVVLPGYPPSREASAAWNLVQTRLRIVVVVSGPPPSLAVITQLNEMHGLERVVAQMDEPSRSGFEHLQRPLSFRKLVE